MIHQQQQKWRLTTSWNISLSASVAEMPPKWIVSMSCKMPSVASDLKQILQQFGLISNIFFLFFPGACWARRQVFSRRKSLSTNSKTSKMLPLHRYCETTCWLQLFVQILTNSRQNFKVYPKFVQNLLKILTLSFSSFVTLKNRLLSEVLQLSTILTGVKSFSRCQEFSNCQKFYKCQQLCQVTAWLEWTIQ